jgi:hypothetical protein
MNGGLPGPRTVNSKTNLPYSVVCSRSWQNRGATHSIALVLPYMMLFLISLVGSAIAADATKYPLCDLRVLYLYDDPARIDWGTVYYLNDEYGCRVDLVTLTGGGGFGTSQREISGQEIYAHSFRVVTSSSSRFDSVYTHLWPDRRPDIVLIGDLDSNGLTARFAAVTTALKAKTESMFNIARVGRWAAVQSSNGITLNAREMFGKYRDRIERESPQLLYDGYEPEEPSAILSQYALESRLGKLGGDFVTGLRTLRLQAVIDSLVPSGGIRDALSRKAGNFVGLLDIAQTQSGKARLESIVNAHDEIKALSEAAKVEPSLAKTAEIAPYLDELTEKVHRAALTETGFDWAGEIVVRDSPYGPKVKFVSSIKISGPATVLVSRVVFHPYWNSATVVLDSMRQTVLPHQAYVREYLIDLDGRKLESQKADSLRFTIELEASGIPVVAESKLPVWNSPLVRVKFLPPYHFVPPFAALEVDKIVTSMSLSVAVTKPLDFAGKARIDLKTPEGMFAGAYRQDLTLEKGQGMESVRIPFSISKLFELGVQQAVVTVSIDGRQVDADTCRVRIAACQIPDTMSIGLLPDTSGQLEDILRMTDAKWQAITDRTLEIGQLASYDLLLIGSGALRNYPSFRKVRGRIEDYLNGGGTVVIMGQPSDWPSAVLPISLAPVTAELSANGVTTADQSHDLLKRPYQIGVSGLSAWFTRPQKITCAVVSPARPVLTGPSGEMLLSVSTIGRGKIIYCGLPLTEMVGSLNIEAIHLLSNILNN